MQLQKLRYLVLGLYALGILLTALLFLATASLLQDGGRQARAGFVPRVYVNSTGNASDGDCEGPPNDRVIGGECTLREAIEEVNEGGTGSIGFVPRVFSGSAPSAIDLENGDGCLPRIQTSGVTIDLSGANVIIDGDDPNNGVRATCQAAIVVAIMYYGFDFTLIGNEDLLIRDLNGDGVALDCGSFTGPNALRNISITGVVVEDITGLAVVDECPTPTPTPTFTPTATHTPTSTATAGTATATGTATITGTATFTLTATSTPVPTDTPLPPTNTVLPTNTNTPAHTPTNTPIPQAGIRGDANCDSAISSVDASLILQLHSGLLHQLTCDANADIDNDGVVTSLDAAIILQLVAEIFSFTDV